MWLNWTGMKQSNGLYDFFVGPYFLPGGEYMVGV